MNKDLDERLVPNGEYRDAMNVQVSTSEGSDVGTVQNILGNVQVLHPNINLSDNHFSTISSISDEKNDSFYWFLAGNTISLSSIIEMFSPDSEDGIAPTVPFVAKDMILKKSNSLIEAVFVDAYGFLTFNNDLGIDSGSPTNTINDNILILDSDTVADIYPGMEVTGVSFTGQVSNTVKVVSTSILNNINIGFDPGFTAGTSTIDMIYPMSNPAHPGGAHGDSLIPLIPALAGGYNPNTQQVYVPDISGQSISSLIGSPIAIDYGGNGVDVHTSTIASISQVNIAFTVGIFSTYYKITLATSSSTLFQTTTFTNSNLTDINGNIYADNTINSSIVTITRSYTNPYANPTGEFILDINDPFIDNIVVGQTKVIPGPYVGGTPFDPDGIANSGDEYFLVSSKNNNIITIEDATGTQIFPGYQTLPNGQPLFGGGWIIFDFEDSGAKQIVLNENINLGNNTYQYLWFEAPKVLNFEKDKLITGVNIIDDMLFWTDGHTEPKKINISRSIEGTNQNGNKHTRLVNKKITPKLHPDLNIGVSLPVKEEHITVIRKSPTKAPIIDSISDRPELPVGQVYSGVTKVGISESDTGIIRSSVGDINDFGALVVGDVVRIFVNQGIDPTNGNLLETFNLVKGKNNSWAIGDTVVLKEFDDNGNQPQIPITNYRIKGEISSYAYNTFSADQNLQTVDAEKVDVWRGGNASAASIGTAKFEIIITSIDGFPPEPSGVATDLNYIIDIFKENEKPFEFKFPRFGYRYKYEDGEYSCFSPFSEVAFEPGSFDYHVKKGYNLGMTNRLMGVILKDFIPEDIPKDVIAVDILYKEDISPNIYLVDTVKPNDEALANNDNNYWYSNNGKGEYHITSDTIRGALPSNQLLRPWDNVPQKALAQEVTGSRIVYGNYEQNFDLLLGDSDKEFLPEIKHSLIANFDNIKSIKSLREYQLGVVFIDEYGRETPVLSNNSGIRKLGKDSAAETTRWKVGMEGLPPAGMKYFKFFIKETSGEYYNMAMDRFYNAEDSNIWLAFPSSDRNKVDIDTFLILKKGTDSNDLILEPARYKILAIENEAPDFIKTKPIVVADINNSGEDTFPDADDAPQENRSYFNMNVAGLGASSASKIDLIQNDTLYVEFEYNGDISRRYRITELTSDRLADTNPTEYYIKIDKKFESDINIILDDPVNPSKVHEGAIVRIYRYVIENSPQFDGRFFVKVYNDSTFEKNIKSISEFISGYNSIAANKVYCMLQDNDHYDLHKQAIYSNYSYDWNGQTDEYIGYVTGGDASLTIPDTSLVFGGNSAQRQFIKNAYRKYSFFGVYDGTGGAIGSLLNPFGNTKGIHGNTPLNRSAGFAALSYNIEKPIWFINRSTHGNSGVGNKIAYLKEKGMGESGLDVGNHPGHGLVSFGAAATPRSRMDLCFGPIYHEKTYYKYANSSQDAWGKFWGGNTHGYRWYLDKISNFFNIGEVGGNEYYDDSTIVEFVDKFVSGKQFRWKEDPTGTVYTIYAGIEKYSRSYYGTSSMPDFENSTYDTDSFHISFPEASLLSAPANYAKLFRLECTPPMVNWNPHDIHDGPIQGGLKLGAKTYTTTGTWSDTSNTITLAGTGADDDELKVGMVLNATNLAPNTKIDSIDTTGATPVITITPNTTGTGSAATITFGFTCRIIDNTYPLFNSTNQPKLHVDNIKLECANTGKIVVLNEGQPFILTTMDGDGTAQDVKAITNVTQYPTIKKVEEVGDGTYYIYLAGYTSTLKNTEVAAIQGHSENDNEGLLTFEQPGMNGASYVTKENYETSINWSGKELTDIAMEAVGYTMEFVNPTYLSSEQLLPESPAIWETEPKESPDIDIYYEISGYNPIVLDIDNIKTTLPVGSVVKVINTEFETTIINNSDASGNKIILEDPAYVEQNTSTLTDVEIGSLISVTKPDGTIIHVTVIDFDDINNGNTNNWVIDTNVYNSWHSLNWHNCYSFGNGVESNRIRDNFNLPFISNGVKASTTLAEQYKKEHRKYGLIYSGIYNSTSGVNDLNQFIAAEKITKDINPIYGSIQKLHSRDTDLITLCEDKVLKILAQKDALFNADGNTNITATQNVLGQTVPFVGEYGISKDPASFASESYRCYFTDKVRGAVMRLSMDGLTPISNHGMRDWFRDNLKITKTIIGSYDDRQDEYNVTLVRNDNDVVNSFVNAYDADRFISEYGLPISKTLTFREDVKGWISFKSFIPENGISCAEEYYTFKNGEVWQHHLPVLYNQKVTNYNKFYGEFIPSSIDVILNDIPGSVKSFNTLNYEGSQAKVTKSLEDDNYTNLIEKEGWHISSIETDQEKGSIVEFIEKEGKWFNYLKGKNIVTNSSGSIISNYDNDSFAIQGIGMTSGATVSTILGCTDDTMFNYNSNATVDDGSCIAIVYGCIDSSNINYNSNANTDTEPTSCAVYGCTDPTATNYNSDANTDDGSCIATVHGCTDNSQTQGLGGFTYNTYANYTAAANVDDGSCVAAVLGCTDPTATNYNSNASIDIPAQFASAYSGSGLVCEYVVMGCIDSNACNQDLNANTDDGSCLYCGDTNANNFDNGSCNTGCNYCFAPISLTIGATTDTSIKIYFEPSTLSNAAHVDEYNATLWKIDPVTGTPVAFCGPGCTGTGSLNYTIDSSTGNYDPITNLWNYTFTGLDDDSTYYITMSSVCSNSISPNITSPNATTLLTQILGCTDPTACNYNILANTDDGSCLLPDGCTDPLYLEYNVNAHCDDGSCATLIVRGCTDPTAINYNPTANVDDNSCIDAVPGCTDNTTLDYEGNIAATNYNASANVDDGSCAYMCPSFIDTSISIPSNNLNSIVWEFPSFGKIPQSIAGSLGGSAWPNTSFRIMYTDTAGTTSDITDEFSWNAGPLTLYGLVEENLSGTQHPQTINIISTLPDHNNTGNTGPGGYLHANGTQSGYNFQTGTYQVYVDVSWSASTGIPQCSNKHLGTFIATEGCMDPNSFNYNSNANVHSTTICIPIVYGCTDSNATNFNANANTDNGSCTYPIPGCTDPLACNYDSNATTDDGSCILPVTGCMDSTACNYNSLANVDASGVCGGSDYSNCCYDPGCSSVTFNAIFNYNSGYNNSTVSINNIQSTAIMGVSLDCVNNVVVKITNTKTNSILTHIFTSGDLATGLLFMDSTIITNFFVNDPDELYTVELIPQCCGTNNSGFTDMSPLPSFTPSNFAP